MKVLSLVLATLLCFSGLVFAGKTTDGLSSKLEGVPKVYQVTPNSAASLSASRWMKFSDCAGESSCCSTMAALSLQYISGAPQFTAIPGLTYDVPVDKAFRATGSILITWTLRIEGQAGGIINPWGSICSVWHGTVTETFKGGDVYSRAYVDTGSGYQAVGQIAKMTIPDGGGGTSTNVYDPTHSGSFLIKAADIVGGFPATVKVKIYWKNDTSLIVTSQANYRSLIVTVLPTN